MKGQVLVSVIMLMIIALAAGISLSMRFVKNLHNSVSVDFASRSLAAAESGAEKTLLIPNATLSGYINGNNCGSNCFYTITGDDGVTSDVSIALSFDGNSTDPHTVDLLTTKITEISLSSYAGTNINVCWQDSGASIYASYIYKTGTTYKANVYAVNAVQPHDPFNGFELATASGGYSNCYTIPTATTPQVLRLKSVYKDVEAFVIPQAGHSLPSQGIVITATGTTKNVSKTVSVLKTYTSLPEIFDYALYQFSNTDDLSND